jgi:hypothetical protein
MVRLFLGTAAFIALAFACVGSIRPALAATAASPMPAASASSSASASPAPGPTVDPAITAKAKEWLHRFQTGDIDRAQLEPSMSTALTADVVKQLKDELAPLATRSRLRSRANNRLARASRRTSIV